MFACDSAQQCKSGFEDQKFLPSNSLLCVENKEFKEFRTKIIHFATLSDSFACQPMFYCIYSDK